MADAPSGNNMPFNGTARGKQGANDGNDDVVFYSVPPEASAPGVFGVQPPDILTVAAQGPGLAPVSALKPISINIDALGEITEEPSRRPAPDILKAAIPQGNISPNPLVQAQTTQPDKSRFVASPHIGGIAKPFISDDESPSRQSTRSSIGGSEREVSPARETPVNVAHQPQAGATNAGASAPRLSGLSLGSIKARLETSNIPRVVPLAPSSAGASQSSAPSPSQSPVIPSTGSAWGSALAPSAGGKHFPEPENKLAFGEARTIEASAMPAPRESALGQRPPPPPPPISPWVASKIEEQSVQKTTPVFSEREISEERMTKEHLTALRISGADHVQAAAPESPQQQTEPALFGFTPVSAPIAPETAVSEASPAVELHSKISSLRTYKSDVVSMIRSQNQTMSRIVLAEQRRNLQSDESQKKEKHTSWLNTLIITISILFIAAGAGAISYMLWTSFSSETGTSRLVLPRSFIVTEKQSRIDTTNRLRHEIVRSVEEKVRGAQLPINHIEGIIFTKTTRPLELFEKPDAVDSVPITLGELFFSLDEGAPPALVRSLANDFLFGIHSFIDNKPFLIVEVQSYTQAFSEMLKWEPYMMANLTTLFAIENTARSKDILFSDAVIKNQDARLIKDANGAVYLVYAFIGKDTLIITTNETTFDELLKRLQTPKEVVR